LVIFLEAEKELIESIENGEMIPMDPEEEKKEIVIGWLRTGYVNF
jgi:hypothetical protein